MLIQPVIMTLNKKCFCGSNEKFSTCCQVFISHKTDQETKPDTKQQAFPQTPEQLMRSRFSAYVIGNSQYIYDTYAKSSRASQSVKDISDWSKACVWIALQVHSYSNKVSSNNKNSNIIRSEFSEQFVEFSAFYITDNTLCELRENSRFILESEEDQYLQWRYIDGDIIEHCELAKVKRKELCPCNHYPTAWSMKKGKKFKQCCGKE